MTTTPLLSRTGRVAAVDVARGLALLGMMTVHLLPATDATGDTSLSHLVASGRASALFAVLAGVGLALVTGGPEPRTSAGTRRGVLARAAVVGTVGLALGSLQPVVAVILVHYAVLFALSVPFLRLTAGRLALWAAGWTLVVPLAAHALREPLAPGPGPQPSLDLLADPVTLLREVLLTGYYPVVVWLGYLLLGLAVGRCDLRSRATGLLLTGAGLLLVGTSQALSVLLLGPLGGLAALVRSGPQDLVGPATTVGDLATSPDFYGTVPTSTWWWQAVAAPHSGTGLDLAATGGSAVLLLGVLLLGLAGRSGPAHVGRRLLAPLAAAGSMTLTLYTLHVLAVTAAPTAPSPALLLLGHVTAALVIASLWRRSGRRGPLELVAHEAARAARSSVRPRSGGDGATPGR